MRMRRQLAGAVLLAAAALAGCGGKVRQLEMRDGAGVTKKVDFPKGTLLGDVSQEQVGALAQMVADTNTATAGRLDAIGAAGDRAAAGVGRVEETAAKIESIVRDVQTDAKRAVGGQKVIEQTVKKVADELGEVAVAVRAVEAAAVRTDAAVKKLAEGEARLEEGQKRAEETAARTLDTSQKTYDATRMIIEAFEKVAKRQGTGEVTVFYPVASSRIERGSLQHDRLVAFVDWLARESRGRRIMFVSVGSASAFGPKELNERLARARSEAPLALIDQYLVNTPHEYVRIYGTGDAYSPRGVKLEEHQRWQHARLIAFYERGQEPALPEAPQP